MTATAGPIMDEARLQRIPLFASLSKRECRELARITDEVDVAEGKHLAEEGSFAYEFMVIEEGTASVIRHGRRVAELGPGEFFGEMGLLDVPGGQRNASVVASAPMTLVVMTGASFRQIAREMPEVARQIRAAVEKRARSLAG
jgi:CRP/FNR family transcriptional regulator, cyclic AMP receptor protein